MKKLSTLLVIVALSVQAFSQEKTDDVPNAVDSNNVSWTYSLSYFVPYNKANDFQKKILRQDAIQGNRISKAQMEMVLFPLNKYDSELQPHFLFRVDVVPSVYLSSRFGVGITSKSKHSSLGGFYGTYYRRVVNESNFTTRRKRNFENYNLYGFYLKSSSDKASFNFSMAFEKTHTYISTRASINVGNLIFRKSQSQNANALKSLEAVCAYEGIYGAGIGLSFSPFDKARIDLLWMNPPQRDIEEQARMQYKLTSGKSITVSYYVD